MKRCPLRNEPVDEPHCTVVRCDAPEEAVTWLRHLQNRLETRAVAGSVRSVTTSELPVTLLLPQANCRRTALLPQRRD
jgi:hypothetical protein